ncbi:MAG: site-2 protease family protein [Planctomycetes bacterium]|nr:site-2 protease family protein [Planctomycetota bacterium]
MNFSLKIASIAGIPIRLHGYFLIYLILLVLPKAFIGGHFQSGPFLEFIVLFGSVVLHELGHAVVARRFGARVVDIVLWPLGGFTRMTHLPERARAEFFVAIAGPAVNLILSFGALALGAYLKIPFTEHYIPKKPPDWDPTFGHDDSILDRIAFINAILGITNLLPAFPLDGGRAARSLFINRFGYLRATEIAVRIGRWIIVIGCVAAFYYLNSPLMIIVLGAFLWFQGGAELANVRMRYGIHPLQAMFTKMFGGAARDPRATEEQYQKARQAQSQAQPQPEEDPRAINKDLESFRGSLDEYFESRRKKDEP